MTRSLLPWKTTSTLPSHAITFRLQILICCARRQAARCAALLPVWYRERQEVVSAVLAPERQAEEPAERPAGPAARAAELQESCNRRLARERRLIRTTQCLVQACELSTPRFPNPTLF